MTTEYRVSVERIERDDIGDCKETEMFIARVPAMPDIEALAALCAAVKPKRVRKPKGGN